MLTKDPLFEVSEDGKVHTLDPNGLPIEVDISHLPEDLQDGVMDRIEGLKELADKNDDPKASDDEADEIAADVTPNLEPWILSEEKAKHEVVDLETEEDYLKKVQEKET